MTTKRLRMAALALAAGAALGTVALAAGPAASQTTQQFSVIERETGYVKFVDIGRNGFSAGDEVLEIHPLFDPGSDEKVGKASTVIEFFRASAQNATVYIDCEVTLPGGTIVFAGAGKFSEAFSETGIVLAVTGGTGDYAGASGSVTLIGGEEGTFVLAFDLTM